ncbi:MAG: site-specific DNA-methyltransferase [Mesorhizobium sp.]
MNASTIQWPADAVERMPVTNLVPYAKNARLHSDTQIDQIATSMAEWGFTMPVLVNEKNEIIAGHGRILAAARLGYDTVPVMVARGWSERQIKAYRIADNKLALNAAWDVTLLSAELSELSGLESLIGFSEDELVQLLAHGNSGLTDPDEVPPLPDEPVTQPGDLWVCGNHRILCGDSTKAEDVGRLLRQAKPNLMVTDPPYGVQYDPSWRNKAARTSASMGNRAIGAGARGKVENDDRADWRDAWELFPGDVAYVWHAALHAATVAEGLLASGFVIRSQIIWDKTRLIIGRGDYQWRHESCWYAVRKGRSGHWAGDRKQSTIWPILHQKSETGHGTQKPVECMRRPILNNSNPGQSIYDPFLGSGTTIIAAEMTGRSGFGLEISPAYVDVCVRRWEAFTGETAVREMPDGQPAIRQSTLPRRNSP